jgi:alkylhydroperoxidase family enzyme
MHPRVAKKAGETDERLFDRGSLLGGETPYFTDAERAALALTRVSDRPDAVSDEV